MSGGTSTSLPAPTAGSEALDRCAAPFDLSWNGPAHGSSTSVRPTARPLTSVGRWAASRGAQWDLYGVDLFPALLSLAGSSPGFRRCAGDALSLPFPDRTFDATICLQTLHHFDDPCAVAVLRELARVSNELVVVSDLRRSLSTYAAARGLAVLYWRNAMTRHDGPRSVRAAFTPPELLALARRAGPEDWQVRAHGPFRLVLECTRTPEAPS